MEKIDPLTGEIVIQEPSQVNKHHDPDSPRPRLRAVYLDDFGREIPDPRPMQPPVGYKPELSIFDIQRQQIELHHRLYAEDREFETFEESEDFDVDDDVDPTSPWENHFDPPMSEIREAVASLEREKAASAPSNIGKPLPSGPAGGGRPPSPNPPSGDSGGLEEPASPALAQDIP